MRENIVFGQKDSTSRFREVVDACGLTHDLEFLPHGEKTEIGEKGVNLSGKLQNFSFFNISSNKRAQVDKR